MAPEDRQRLQELATRLQREVHERAVHANALFSPAHWQHNAGEFWPHEPDDGSYTLFENCVHPDCALVRAGGVPQPETKQEPPTQPLQEAIDAAISFSTLSPCRSKRGVAVFFDGQVRGGGYNYKPGNLCDGSERCKATCRDEAVHAEQQALLTLGRRANGCEMLHVKTVDGVLVPSGPPSCVQCSKLALAAGIAAVWLFRGEDGWVRYPTNVFHGLSLRLRAGGVPQPVTEIKCRHCGEDIRLMDGEWLDRETHSVCGESTQKHEPIDQSEDGTLVGQLTAIVREADARRRKEATVNESCPHCGLPAVMPEKCTPQLNEVLERNLARDGELFEAGRQHGIKFPPPAADAGRSRIDLEVLPVEVWNEFEMAVWGKIGNTLEHRQANRIEAFLLPLVRAQTDHASLLQRLRALEQQMRSEVARATEENLPRTSAAYLGCANAIASLLEASEGEQ